MRRPKARDGIRESAALEPFLGEGILDNQHIYTLCLWVSRIYLKSQSVCIYIPMYIYIYTYTCTHIESPCKYSFFWHLDPLGRYYAATRYLTQTLYDECLGKNRRRSPTPRRRSAALGKFLKPNVSKEQVILSNATCV